VAVFRKGAATALVVSQKMECVSISRARMSGEGIHIAPRQGQKPAPLPPQRSADASDNLGSGRLAGQKGLGKHLQEKRLPHGRLRRNPSNESHPA
jgi:hypothetical protein